MNKFEEYKLFVEDTAKFTERRQQISITYVTVNSIILSAMALFLGQTTEIDAIWPSAIVLVVFSVGIFVCVLWKQIIYKYKVLVNFRINELREIEKHPDMQGCHKMYHAEDKLYPRNANDEPIKGKALNISDKEKWLPCVFMFVYIAFLIVHLGYLIFSDF